jgi:hypothetical protein
VFDNANWFTAGVCGPSVWNKCTHAGTTIVPLESEAIAARFLMFAREPWLCSDIAPPPPSPNTLRISSFRCHERNRASAEIGYGEIRGTLPAVAT